MFPMKKKVLIKKYLIKKISDKEDNAIKLTQKLNKE